MPKEAKPCTKLRKCAHVKELDDKFQTMAKLMEHFRERLLVETRMRESAEAQLLTDPLTGAFNRRGLEKNFLEECSKAERLKRRLFLIFTDIDNFKSFNEEHGEHTGDIVLKEVVQTIKMNIRPYDSVYRQGGEEFIILLPELRSYKTACKTAERIRKKIEQVQITPHDGGEPLGVTISIGVARLGHGDSIDTLVDKANKAEREAKKAGKNCSFIYLGGEVIPLKNLLQQIKEKEMSRKPGMKGRKLVRSAKEELDAALRGAAKSGNRMMVSELLTRGADVNSANKDGWTPLMWASREDKTIVGLLLDAKADIEAANSLGWTALIVASRYGCYDVVEYLMEKGANPDAVDNEGKNALDHAIARGHAGVAGVLGKLKKEL